MVNAALAGDPELVQRFEQEARVAGSLKHPNLVAVYDVGRHEGVPYFVTELLEGESLRQRLTRGRIPLETALELGGSARPRACGRARARGHPPRREAGERVRQPRRPGEAPGLRDRQARRGRRAARGTARTDGRDGDPDRERDRGPAPCSAPRGTCPRSRCGASRSTRGRTCSAWARCCTSCSRAPAPSRAARSSRAGTPSSTTTRPRSRRRCRRRWPRSSCGAWRRSRTAGSSRRAIPPSRSRCCGEAPAQRSRGRCPLARTGRGCRSPALALLALGFAAGSIAWSRTTRSVPVSLPTVEQVTFRWGAVRAARFAPDGRVFFSATFEGRPEEVFTRPVGSAMSQPLGLPSARLLAVSGTGELAVLLAPRFSVLYTAQGTLARVPGVGGTPREVAEDVEYADWSPGRRARAGDRPGHRPYPGVPTRKGPLPAPRDGSATPASRAAETSSPSSTIPSSATAWAR